MIWKIFGSKRNVVNMKKNKRLYDIQHKLIAITGGIATGKSTVGKIIREMGYPVVSADQMIKEIYQQDETYQIINDDYPEIIKNNQIHFSSLRKIYFQDNDFKERLNKHIYPELSKKIKEFASFYPIDRTLFYEVPLLFEKKLEDQVDAVILVYASEEIQRERIKKRDKSDKETIDAVLSHQLPIEEKRAMSAYIIENNDEVLDLDHLKTQIKAILGQLLD